MNFYKFMLNFINANTDRGFLIEIAPVALEQNRKNIFMLLYSFSITEGNTNLH